MTVAKTRSYEEQLAELDEQMSRLRARRQALAARHTKDERKARDHALCVAGGLVLSCYPNGWQSVDWPSLAAMVRSNEKVFARHATETLPTPEASKRLRQWERKDREARDHAYEDEEVREAAGVTGTQAADGSQGR